MGSIRKRNDTNMLFFDFQYRDQRCREYSLLVDTQANRKQMEKALARIESEIKLGTFDYGRFFPNSPMAVKFQIKKQNGSRITNKDHMPAELAETKPQTPILRDFANEWYHEGEISWKRSYRATIRLTLDKYLIPKFGDSEVSCITKGDILKFRSTLAKVLIGTKEGLSVNRRAIMTHFGG